MNQAYIELMGSDRRWSPKTGQCAKLRVGPFNDGGTDDGNQTQTIMTGIWSTPLMKIIPSPPNGGESFYNSPLAP